jgi:3-carboxy-cis,cis-muconate cycloisomerase
VTDARLDELLDPAGYRGDAAGIVDRVLADYEATAAQLREPLRGQLRGA